MQTMRVLVASLTLLAGGTVCHGQGGTNPPRVVIPEGPTWGVGGGRLDINMPLTRRPGSIEPLPPPVVSPPQCPPRPPVICPPVPCPPPPCLPPPCRPRSRLVLTGSGLTVSGSYTGEKWRVGFNLGSPHVVYGVSDAGGCYLPDGYPYAVSPGYVYPYDVRSRVLRAGEGPLDPNLFREQPPPSQPQAMTPPSEPPTALEVGVLALQDQKSEQAVGALRQHLRDNPDDARAMRVLALALLEAREFDDAAGVMRRAYRLDAALAHERLPADEIGLSRERLRDAVKRAVTYAHRVNTASSWLLACVLMQGEGRDEPARRMLEKSERLGLEREIVEALRVELGR